MWKLLFDSAIGSSHERSGVPCQDYSLGKIVESSCGSVLLAACSDGAGSAEYSALGARIACQVVVDRVWNVLQDQSFSPEHITRIKVRDWIDEARSMIAGEATVLGIAPRGLACTLLLAIVGESWAAFGQIGDGAIVGHDGMESRIIFWPASGEYANTTSFVTDNNFDDCIQFVFIDSIIYDLAIFTDGLQMLALDYSSKQAHWPFFKPMFETLHSIEDVELLKLPLRNFLNSTPVNDRTDDDKTLLLATRPIPSAQTHSVDESR